jgi:hypothetical protein
MLIDLVLKRLLVGEETEKKNKIRGVAFAFGAMPREREEPNKTPERIWRPLPKGTGR